MEHQHLPLLVVQLPEGTEDSAVKRCSIELEVLVSSSLLGKDLA